MAPLLVTARIALACAAADRALVSENGAMRPVLWHPAHFPAKIGATSAHPGAAATLTGRLPREPDASTATRAPTAAATTARAKPRFTTVNVAEKGALVSRADDRPGNALAGHALRGPRWSAAGRGRAHLRRGAVCERYPGRAPGDSERR